MGRYYAPMPTWRVKTQNYLIQAIKFSALMSAEYIADIVSFPKNEDIVVILKDFMFPMVDRKSVEQSNTAAWIDNNAVRVSDYVGTPVTLQKPFVLEFREYIVEQMKFTADVPPLQYEPPIMRIDENIAMTVHIEGPTWDEKKRMGRYYVK